MVRQRHNLEEGQVTFVAERGGFVRGFAAVHDPPGLAGYDAEIGALYVHPAHVREGAGRALVAATCRYLAGQGRTHLAIHTLRDNFVGCAFYERLGGSIVAADEWTFRGIPYQAVWYGFPDLRALADVRGVERETRTPQP